MTFPTLSLAAAWTTAPLAASPNYVALLSPDGSSRVNSGQISRALNRAGTASFVLDNLDDALNPWNVASSYYGNLLEGITANPESSTAGWTNVANTTLATSTFDKVVGVGSLEITGTVAGAWSVVTTNRFNVVAGKVFTPSIQVRTREHTETINVTVRWWDDAGVSKGSSIGGGVTVGASFVQLGAFNPTAPVGATKADLLVAGTAIANGDRVYLDAAQLQGGTSATWAAPHSSGNGNMQPRAKFQFGVTWSGVTYYPYTGHATKLSCEWQDIDYGDATVTLVDAFKFLTLIKRPRTDYRDLEIALGADAIYGLDETSTTPASGGIIPTADSSGNGNNGHYAGQSPNFGLFGALPADVGTAVGFTREEALLAGSWVELPNAACPTGTANFTISAWVKPNSFNANQPVDQIWHVTDVGSQSLYLIINSDGKVKFTAIGSGVNGGTLGATAVLIRGLWNHIVVVKSGTTGPTNWRIYLNGVDVSDHAGEVLAGTGNASLTANATLLGGYESSVLTSGVIRGRLDGALDEVAIWKTVALTPTNVADLYAASFGLSAPTLSGVRVGQVLDLVGVAAGDRALDAGQFTVQAVNQPVYDTPPLALILTGNGSMVESEGWPAAFFVGGGGAYVYQDRSHATPSSSATFTDTSSTLYFDAGAGPERTDDNLWTVVVLQADNGQPQTAGDAAALGETLTRTGLKNASDADVATMAGDLLARYSTAKDRLATLVIHPIMEPATMWPQVLGRELNDVITVTRTDLPGGGLKFTGQFRIVGITHSFTGLDWTTTWQLEPV